MHSSSILVISKIWSTNIPIWNSSNDKTNILGLGFSKMLGVEVSKKDEKFIIVINFPLKLIIPEI